MVDRVGKLLHSISFIRFFLVIYRLGLCHKLNDFVLLLASKSKKKILCCLISHSVLQKFLEAV